MRRADDQSDGARRDTSELTPLLTAAQLTDHSAQQDSTESGDCHACNREQDTRARLHDSLDSWMRREHVATCPDGERIK
jgi:hypothetical protein